MKKLILIIAIVAIVGKFLLYSDGSFIPTGGILGILGGPLLIILIILWLLKPKKHKTGIDEIDDYL